jgi:isoamylase
VEGPTSDPDILTLRARQQRNLLVTLFLSQGVPMLSGGDELGRTQFGNNNAYSQDSELSWHDWSAVDETMHAFTRDLIAFRRAHPVFRRRHWFRDGMTADADAASERDIEWHRPSGGDMQDDDWHIADAAAIAVFLSGEGLVDVEGSPLQDDAFYMMINATAADLAFGLPESRLGTRWTLALDTAADRPFESGRDDLSADDSTIVVSRSIQCFRRLD